ARWAPDPRRRRRDGLKAHPLEDRAAVVGGVDLQVEAAALGGEPATVGDDRAIDPAVPVLLDGAAAPQRAELGIRGEAQPARAHHAAVRLCDDDAKRLRVGRLLALERLSARRVVLRPDLVLHRLDALELG